jgi:hypothetical protein
MDDAFGVLAMFILCICGVFIGKLMDVQWRVWFLRQVTKKDYHILAFTSKDKKNIFRYVINPENDVFVHKGMLFVVERGRIYREKNIDDGWLISKAPKASEVGVPVIFCDADSMRPIVFENHTDPVKPSEAGTVLTAWIENQINKNFEQRDRIQTIVMICCGVVLLVGILVYMQGQNIVDIQNRLYPIEYKLGVRVLNQTINGTSQGTINIPT